MKRVFYKIMLEFFQQFFFNNKSFQKHKLDYVFKEENISIDWAAGMFLLFPKELYNILGGFDTSITCILKMLIFVGELNKKILMLSYVPKFKLFILGKGLVKEDLIILFGIL